MIIPYTKLGLPMKGSSLIGYLEKKEIYAEGISLAEFKEAHFKRWNSFAENCLNHDDQKIYIFECAYFQNHVNQLLGTYFLDEASIKDYMMELMATVKDLNPFLFYLTQPHVEETIGRIAKERVSPDKSKWDDWIDLMIAYIEKLPYVKEKNYKGYEGGIQFIKDRKDIELSIFDKLQTPKAMIHNDRYDWDAVYKDLEGYLEQMISGAPSSPSH